ncbi:iron-containing alcohol dehydrogenase [Tichowtungia aerotolerans]|uniref:Iron-containing alcohol dehydrogenase n=1 Tax=Tichowtungia aerotolerans TaxID=2697043 RepID=A0A6P1M918_9BACT|nr:iron-containing alcohol dehydrogenase [Tichowtungia aerotolerans]QHI69563.1 iron-containing alcohol dehydrogenase [Tichowtungia aerotolerans]
MFEFATAGKIIFGNGTLKQAAPVAAVFGRKALVVTGRDTDRAAPLMDALAALGINCEMFAVSGEPTVELACQASQFAVDVVIGFGGGSVIDLAKAAAALMSNPGDPLDYLEVIGKGQPLTERAVPCIAIPTTAGTGAEVTKNAVLASPEHKVKVSMRHPFMIPDLAIVDPECTLSMPPAVTASTGLDALTQLLEAFISKKATPVTDGFCREGLPRAVRSLRRVFENGDDLAAREDMALASLFGGLALANAGLGAVHGFAGPVGGMFSAPHGMVCAALLPHVMKVNLAALREREPNVQTLERFDEFSRMTGGSKAEDGISWLAGLCRDLQVPALSTFGITEADFPVIVEKSKNASSMKGNAVELSDAQLTHILQAAWL